MRNIALGEPDAGAREFIQVGCLYDLAAMKAEIGVPGIIGKDENDIGLARGLASESAREWQSQGNKDDCCDVFFHYSTIR